MVHLRHRQKLCRRLGGCIAVADAGSLRLGGHRCQPLRPTMGSYFRDQDRSAAVDPWLPMGILCGFAGPGLVAFPRGRKAAVHLFPVLGTTPAESGVSPALSPGLSPNRLA